MSVAPGISSITYCGCDFSPEPWVARLSQKVGRCHDRERHPETDHNSTTDEKASALGCGLHYGSDNLEELPKLQHESSPKAISWEGGAKGAHESSDAQGGGNETEHFRRGVVHRCESKSV